MLPDVERIATYYAKLNREKIAVVGVQKDIKVLVGIIRELEETVAGLYRALDTMRRESL